MKLVLILKKVISPLLLFLLSLLVFGQTNTFPDIENFDNQSYCNQGCWDTCLLTSKWKNVNTDQRDWLTDTNGVGQTINTGPSSDHTTGTPSGVYLYMRVLNCYGSSANLISPIYDFTAVSNPGISFWSHLNSPYPRSDTKLHFDVSTNNGVSFNNDFVPPWTRNLNAWKEEIIDLTPFGGMDSIVFRIRATSRYINIALDDITVFSNSTFKIETKKINDNLCFGSKTGSACVSRFEFGTPPFTYQWSNGATTDTIKNLAAGKYDVSVYDNLNKVTLGSVIINDSQKPIYKIDASIYDVNCPTSNDGIIQLDSIKGGKPYNLCANINTTLCTGISKSDTLGFDSLLNINYEFPSVYGNFSRSSKHQILYTAAELNAQGISGASLISAISFDVEVNSGSNPNNSYNFIIKAGCTNNTKLSGSWINGLSSVLNSSTVALTTGWNKHQFDTPYLWDGVSNLVIEVCFVNPGFSNNHKVKQSITADTTVMFRKNSSNSCTSSAFDGISNKRPNTIFETCRIPSNKYKLSWSNLDSSASITGLQAGNYTLTISDADNCAFIDTFTVKSYPIIKNEVIQNVPCYNDSVGSITLNSTGGNVGKVKKLLITEVRICDPDFVEISNVSGAPFDATGWYIAIGDQYSNINIENPNTWDLSGILPEGWIDFKNDSNYQNPKYWGSNMYWQCPGMGWVALIDSNANVQDFVAWFWDSTQIQSMSPIIKGDTIRINNEWKGNGIVSSSTSLNFTRIGRIDNNSAADWVLAADTKGKRNLGLSTRVMGRDKSPYKYNWSTGDTTNSINSLTNGSYYITITDANNCISLDSFSIKVTSIDTSVSTFPTFLASKTYGASYQWVNCDSNYTPIHGDTNQLFAPSINGNFAVIVSKNGCTDTSGCHNITLTSIKENRTENKFIVYPNPSSGNFTIQLAGLKIKNQYLRIYNTKGQLIIDEQLTKNNLEFSLTGFDKGIYILRIGNQTRKLVLTE